MHSSYSQVEKIKDISLSDPNLNKTSSNVHNYKATRRKSFSYNNIYINLVQNQNKQLLQDECTQANLEEDTKVTEDQGIKCERRISFSFPIYQISDPRLRGRYISIDIPSKEIEQKSNKTSH